jgi:hypothetical protein
MNHPGRLRSGALHLSISTLISISIAFSSSSYAAITFQSPFTAFHTNDSNAAIDVGDVDGDGRLDIVSTGESSIASVRLLRGLGDGTFMPVTVVGDAKSPHALSLADLDGDGDLDVVTAGGYALSVLLGQGDGTFGTRSDYLTGGFSSSPRRSVALADFNGDGHLDAAMNDGCCSLSLFLGVGNGTFATRTAIATPSVAASDLAAADMNEDGDIDLVAPGSDSLRVLIGHGDGTFGPMVSSRNDGFRCVVVDVNGDGHLDVIGIRSRFPAQGDDAAVSLGNGTGSFSSQSLYSLPDHPTFLAAGDLDADGRPDLVAANLPTNWAATISVLRNHGDGTLETVHKYAAPQWPRSPRLADFDGDGFTDIALPTRTGAAVAIYAGNGDGTLGGGRSFVVGGQPSDPSPSDLNADGRPDVVLINYGAIQVMLNDGSGGLALTTTLETDNHYNVAIGDLDGDGFGDIVATHYELPDGTPDSTLSVWLGHGDGTFGSRSTWLTGRHPNQVELADLDSDGHLDIVVVDHYDYADAPDDGLSLSRGNGDGTFEPFVPVTIGREVEYFEVVDFDGNGLADLAIQMRGGDSLLVLMANGFGAYARSALRPGGSVLGVTTGDFDGDGDPDVAAGFESGIPDHALVLLGHGDGTFTAGPSVETSFAGYVARAADLDLDGHLDLISATGWSNSYRMLRGHGDGTFEPATFEYGLDASIAGHPPIVDLDGDGRPDLIGASEYMDDVSVILNSTLVQTVAAERPRAIGNALALTGIAPNPARGPIEVSFVLPDKAPATLELFDVTGRRLRSIQVGHLGPGLHRVRLSPEARLPSGIYFATLRQSGAARTRRVGVIQ